MVWIKKLLPFVCLPISLLSVYLSFNSESVPMWQAIVYSIVIWIPCTLVLFWKPFDRQFGFATREQIRQGNWRSVTPWIGWLMLAMMILMNHFARPPADF